MPNLLENGHPDYRIQKWNNHNGYKDMYLCDNFMQFKTAIEDFEYTKWLDPAGVPCYVCDKLDRYLITNGSKRNSSKVFQWCFYVKI